MNPGTVLKKKYPSLFNERSDISIQEGWLDLVDKLILSISYYCETNSQEKIKIMRIKEKFGTLRFYYEGGNDMIRGMAWFAEHMSTLICEKCGSTNKVETIKADWLKTYCQVCAKDHLKRYKDPKQLEFTL